jgi:hypothetical protein
MDKSNTGDLTPFSKATEVYPLSSHTYSANLVDSFCIGTGKLGCSLSCHGPSRIPNRHPQFPTAAM